MLIVPPELARTNSPQARAMLGYSIHPPFIGQVDGMNPQRLVDEHYHSHGRTHLHQAAAAADAVLLQPQVLPDGSVAH